MLAYKTVFIFNDLHDSDLASAHKLDKDCTRPTYESLSFSLSASVRKVCDVLVADRALNKIFRTKASNENFPSIGDLAQVYRKRARKNTKNGLITSIWLR